MSTSLARVPLRRLPDWQPRLAQLISKRMQHPLAWGLHDCAMFAADAVQAVTGVDLAEDLRGTYSTAEGAEATLQQHGGLVGLCVQRLGPVVRASMAQPGDIGLAQVGDKRGLVVCGGAHFLGVGALCLQPLPPSVVLRAWRCAGGVDG